MIDETSNYEVGDRLKADDVNALISWANRRKSVRGFLTDNTEIAQYKSQSPAALHLTNTTGEAIKPFSVFSIIYNASSSSSSATNKGVPEGNAQIFDIAPNASTFLFISNGAIEIPENGKFEAELISFNKPTRVRASASDIPEPGEPCGVSFGEMRVSTHANGLICLTPSFEEDDETYVWVCRSREPIKVVGCVTSKITKAVKIEGQTVAGYGQLQIVYRNQFNQLNSVNRPAFPQTSRWNVKVFNYSEIEYGTGMMVSATDTLSIGLTVDYDQPNQLCAAGSSSSSRSSSSFSSSSLSSDSSSSSSSDSSSSSSSSSSISSIYPQTCCPEIGFSWTDFPPLLNVTFTNACCAGMNYSKQYESGPIGTGIVKYTEVNLAGSAGRCNGANIASSNTAFFCGLDPITSLPRWAFTGGNWGTGETLITLLSCVPLHLIGTIPVLAGAFGTYCNGTVDFEATE